jgi:uncharacterized protein
MTAPRQRIAVVGSGIAGMTCAHVLGPHHDVVLFEASDRLGGHANTVAVDDPDAGSLAVDTGFIVHNDRNYPNFVRLINELGVQAFDTEMSFAVTDRVVGSPTDGLTYRATSLNTVFADRRNLVRPTIWRMMADIARFYRAARRFLADPDPAITLDRFLADGDYSSAFLDLHLVPMGAAVWSADPKTFGEYPAQTLLTFLSNHGLLGVRDRPQWRSIANGSRTYVDEIERRFAGEIRRSTPVLDVRRTESSVLVTTAGRVDRFDRVVFATHSDQTSRLLDDATPIERKVLEAVRYQPNRATLHTDTSLLPPNRRAWAAWNYDRRSAGQRLATVTYDLTTLQHLPGRHRYLVTLNSDDLIAPDSVVAGFDYMHPVFDLAAIDAQERFDEIDGVDRVHYCGAWWGNGFHEDGISSALRVCDRIGVRW